jgi:hypothetical protein
MSWLSLLRSWDPSSRQDLIVKFYQERSPKDPTDIVFVTSEDETKLQIQKEKTIKEMWDETKLENLEEKLKACYSAGDIPVVFKTVATETYQGFVAIRNKIFKASSETERKARMTQMLDFLTEHEDIPLDKTFEMLDAAIKGQEIEGYLYYMKLKLAKLSLDS